jgi:hypothetical protein
MTAEGLVAAAKLAGLGPGQVKWRDDVVRAYERNMEHQAPAFGHYSDVSRAVGLACSGAGCRTPWLARQAPRVAMRYRLRTLLPSNRWLRFSLRMLFLLTLAVAVSLGVMMKRLRDRKAAVDSIHAAGGTMGVRIAGPKWLRGLINDEHCYFEPLRVSLGPIARQRGQKAPTLDDASLARLRGVLKNFKRLEVLDLSGDITDQSAELLGSLKDLTHLRLSDTQIANQTIRQVSRLRHIQSLDLHGTAVNDNCIDDLCQMSSLADLDVGNTQITTDGVARLKRQLPRCKIAN